MRARLCLSVLFMITIPFAATTWADCTTLDYVDLGDTDSEAGHAMVGWGPIEPATSGGNYGGIADCRAVYAPEDGDDWATIALDFGDDPTTCKIFSIHHLDGQTQDSFEVYIAGALVYTYTGDALTTENWYELKLDVCLTGVQTVKFVSTAPLWASWDIYGQMCFDILKVEQCADVCGMLDLVDIGDPLSEASHGLTGWGPIEPATSGGAYGGIANCRAVYAPEDDNVSATVDLNFGDDELVAKCLTMHHLEGIGLDAFDLYLHPQGHPTQKELIYSFAGDEQSAELWLQTSILVAATGTQTLTFVSTALPWSGWATYGQMCFDLLRVDVCPPEKATVDIGDPTSEAGYNLVGWGPIEPATSGGGYGGIDNCRPIYAPEDGDAWATLDVDFGCCAGLKCLALEHLDGIGKDSFEVYLYPAGDPDAAELILTYEGNDLSTEIWQTSSVLVSAVGLQTIKLVSTEPQWSGWATYGQMCFNTIAVRDYAPVMDAVMIGDPASESGHAMTGWGPIEPATSGGNYGSAPECRPIYAPEDNDAFATIELDFGTCAETCKCLTMHHLDGLAADAFDVYIYPPGGTRPVTPAYSYAGDAQTAEIWYRTSFAVAATGRQVVEFVSTEPTWDQWDVYGQVCFRALRVENCTPCEPTPYTFFPTQVVDGGVPQRSQITSVAPNPFNPKTEIRFAQQMDAHTDLSIYDVRGHMVATLVDEYLTAGPYMFAWHGFDTAGRKASSGVYFAHLKIGGDLVDVKKVSLIK